MYTNNVTWSFDTSLSMAQSHWSSKCGIPPPSESLQIAQRAWDDAIFSTRMEYLLSSVSDADRARLLASGSTGSGTWLHARPSANIGFKLSDQELKVSVGPRLGSKFVSAHICFQK